MNDTHEPVVSPYDTALSAGLRFVVEIIAWVAGPWAVADLSGQTWTAVPTAIVLIGASALFSTPGDKNNVVIPTPGPIRLVIEVITHVVALLGAWVVWPNWAGLLTAILVIGSLTAGVPRARWLARGAADEA
jgi:hypothetical protein